MLNWSDGGKRMSSEWGLYNGMQSRGSEISLCASFRERLV